MIRCPDWDDDAYMDWADQERLVQQDMEVMDRVRARSEYKEELHERTDIEGETEPGEYRTEL